jgi:hypothetical protein
VKVGTQRQSTMIEKRTSARRRRASSNCLSVNGFEPVSTGDRGVRAPGVDRQTDHDAIMRGRVDVPVLREMAGSRVGVTEGLREGVLVVDHSAPASDPRPGLPDIDRPLAEARDPPQAALRGRVVSLSFERVHSIPARSSRCPFVGNRRFQPKSAFSRFPPVYKTSLERQLRVDLTRFVAPFGYDRYLRFSAVH